MTWIRKVFSGLAYISFTLCILLCFNLATSYLLKCRLEFPVLLFVSVCVSPTIIVLKKGFSKHLKVVFIALCPILFFINSMGQKTLAPCSNSQRTESKQR